MYYFSYNSIIEITKIISNIIVLFQQPIQIELLNFVSEITQNGCCELTKYQEVLSLLQDDENKKKPVREQKKIRTDKTEYENAHQQLEYLIMMLISRAFVSQSVNLYSQKHLAQEVKK